MNRMESVIRIVREYYKDACDFTFIYRGVMNFKYQFRSSGKYYIIRCFTKNRNFLASAEFKYISLFREKGVRVPFVTFFSERPFPYLIYEMLPGECLGDVFDRLPVDYQRNLCSQIYENYESLSAIRTSGCGTFSHFDQFEQISWRGYLNSELQKSFDYLSTANKSFNLRILRLYVDHFLKEKISNERNLVWTDFSLDNIIVTPDGNLSGFIDFEGLLGGDPLMGFGYLQASSSETSFYRSFYEIMDLDRYREVIDFYSVVRYLRLIPYENTLLPNGEQRKRVESFLSNSMMLINNICNDGK